MDNFELEGISIDLNSMVETLLLDGSLDKAFELQQSKLKNDPEWNRPMYFHKSTLLQAFVNGILTADPWYHKYRLPPGFESVVNFMAYEIDMKWPNEEVPCVTLMEMRDFYNEIAVQHPQFLKWNETEKLGGVVTRYDPVPAERDFIDLDVVFHNATLFLYEDNRRFEEFERKFEEENQGDRN